MASRIKVLLLLGSTLGLSGCSIMHAQSRIDPRTVAIYDNVTKGCFSARAHDDANQGAIDLDCAKFPENPDKTAYYLAAVGDTQDAAKVEQTRVYYRNRLAWMLMKHSDDACIASLGRATNNEAVSNIVLELLTTATAAASTVVSGNTAKSILSATAATASGTRDHINAEVFRNTLVSAITKAITADRNRIASEIQLDLARPSAEYDVDRMIREVNRYHQACSYFNGLQLVVQAVDRSTPNQADRLKALDDAIKTLQDQMAKAGAQSEGSKNQLDQLIQFRAATAAIPTDKPTTPQAPPPPTDVTPPPAADPQVVKPEPALPKGQSQMKGRKPGNP
jgi:hypothetical protein